MKRWLFAIVGLLLAGAALAAGVRAARERVEGSMVVTGTIGVTPQGTVLGYTLDHPEKLPPVVVNVIGRDVPRWTFEPVVRDGKAVAAKTRMSLRLVAHPIGDGNYQVGIRSAYFGDQSAGIKALSRERPRYPRAAIEARAGGTAYVVMLVDRTGHVANAFTQQVNMRVLAGDDELDRLRGVLADASVKALRQWTFTPAAASDKNPYREVRVPVSYDISEGNQPRAHEEYGQWQGYVPGPLEPAPWFDKNDMFTGGADALPGDGIYDQSQLSLRTRLDQG